MTDPATASPRPWRATEYEAGPQDIYDANGFRVCTMGITTSSDADAALIVEAVNERERLRDLVERMAAYIQVGAIGGALLREARAAIGNSLKGDDHA